MLGGSSSNTSGQTSGVLITSTEMQTKTSFSCNTCELMFENPQTQRAHMRESWQYDVREHHWDKQNADIYGSIYNLKRRMASLPSISADAYTENEATPLTSSKPQSTQRTLLSSPIQPSRIEEKHHDDGNDIEPNKIRRDHTNDCLFCNIHSNTPKSSLQHMTSEHSLYIPEPERLLNLETTLDYLRTVITEYNECLFCGITKPSTQSIQRHMLDKGHCMINLEREPELLEFWECSDSSGQEIDENGDNGEEQDQSIPRSRSIGRTDYKGLSEGEYTLPSGKILGSKSKAREARLAARQRIPVQIRDTSDHHLSIVTNHPDVTVQPISTLTNAQTRSQDHSDLTVRDAAGLLGVSNQQVRSLVTLQRKMQRQQDIVRASRRWADELGGTHQKHYKQKMNLRDG